MAVLMGLFGWAGMSFLLHYRRSRKFHTPEPLFLLFGLMCFLLIGFTAGELTAYHSANAQEYVRAYRYRGVFATLFLMIWPWFLARYSSIGLRWLVIFLSLYPVPSFLAEILRPYGSYFDTLPRIEHLSLPWNESIAFHADSHMNVHGALIWVGIVATLIFGHYAWYVQYKRGERGPALMLLAALSIFTAAVVENMFVRAGLLDFIFLAQYGFPTMILVMGLTLHQRALSLDTKYHNLFELAGDVIIVSHARSGDILEVNPAAEKLYGYDRTEFLNMNIFDLSSEQSVQDINPLMQQMYEHGTMTFEREHRDHKGHSIPTEVTGRLITLQGVPMFLSIVRDLRKTRQEQLKLQQSDTLLRTLFDSSSDGITLLYDGVFIDSNPGALKIFGCQREDFIGSTLADFSPEVQYDGNKSTRIAMKKLQAALAGTPQRFDWLHQQLDGTPFDAEVSINRIELGGEPVVQCIVRDVTARKRTEQTIQLISAGVSAQTGEQFFRQLLEHLSRLFDADYTFIGVLHHDDPPRIETLAVCAHGSTAENLSYTLAGTPCANVTTLDGTCAYERGVQEMFPEDQLLADMNVEGYIGTPLLNSQGHPVGVLVVLDSKPLRHTTHVSTVLEIFAARASAELERIQAHQALAESERQLSEAQRMAHMGNWVINFGTSTWGIDSPDSRLSWSAEIFEILGIQDTEGVASYENFMAAVHPEDRAEVAAVCVASLKNKTPYSIAHRLRMPNGAIKHVLHHCEVSYDEAGSPVRLIGTIQDVSQQTAMEEALRRSQKMDAVGQLSGGIAHDFNNQLGVIMGYLDFLDELLPNDKTSSQWFMAANNAVTRCTDLTRQLLTFSRRSSTETHPVDINRELLGLNQLIRRSVTPAISVRSVLEDNLWTVCINPGEFQDCILNLVLNARDAMPDGGNLLIEAANKIVDVEYAERNPDLEPGEYVQIMLSDTGRGIDTQALERIFEPFFTTKPEGQGTGLGLAMVYGFAMRSGGQIKVYSELNIGTIFRLYLPRTQGTSVAPTKPLTTELPKGEETILIVDDEADLLWLAGEYLKSLGYQTLLAAEPKQALQLLQEHNDVDLLFSDVVMPGGTNGYALAEQALSHAPTLKVLLTSGFSANTMAVNEQACFAAHLLNKPYRKEELARRVRLVLDESNNSP